MSTIKTTPTGPRFEGRHLDHITKRAQEGASNTVIATELSHLGDEFDAASGFDADNVGMMRTAMRLPAEDSEKVLNAAIRQPKDPSNKNVPGFSDKKTIRTRTLSSKKLARQSRQAVPLQQFFSETVMSAKTLLSEIQSVETPSGKLKIAPVKIAFAQAGMICMAPGVGPVRCEGQKTETIAGSLESRFYFREMFPKSGARLLIVPPDRVPQKNFREPASVEDLERVIRALADKAISPLSVPRLTGPRNEVLSKTLNAGNPVGLASIAALAFQSGRSASGTMDTDYANTALRLLAGEYAIVKKIPIELAAELMDRAAAKPTLADLSKYMQKQAADPAP